MSHKERIALAQYFRVKNLYKDRKQAKLIVLLLVFLLDLHFKPKKLYFTTVVSNLLRSIKRVQLIQLVITFIKYLQVSFLPLFLIYFIKHYGLR